MLGWDVLVQGLALVLFSTIILMSPPLLGRFDEWTYFKGTSSPPCPGVEDVEPDIGNNVRPPILPKYVCGAKQNRKRKIPCYIVQSQHNFYFMLIGNKQTCYFLQFQKNVPCQKSHLPTAIL